MHSQQQVNQNPAARMMKDSEIEWIGMIPNEWEVVRVKNLFRATKRIVGDAADKYERLALTLNGVIKRSKEDSEGLQPEKFEGYQILKENELVFKLIDLENLRTSRVGLSPYTGLVSPAYIVLTNDSKDNRFPYYYFMSMYYRAIFNSLGGDGVRSALNKLDLLNIPYVYPPLHEQQAIATYLDEQVEKIDTLIVEQKVAMEKWKEYKQSLITETVTKGLNPNVEMKDSGVEWIGDIPKAWGVYPIKHVAGLNPAYADLLEDANSVSFAPMETLRTGRLKPYKALLSDVKGRYTPFKENDILMAKVTPCFENGNIAIATGLINGVGFGSSEFYVFRAKRCETSFLYYFLQNDVFKQEAVSTMYGTGGLKRVNSSFVKNYKIPLPPLHEQQAITDYLDEKCSKIDQTIEQKELLIKQLEEYKQSLIYECVTGKRRVH